MGYFSEIVSDARRCNSANAVVTSAAAPAAAPAPATENTPHKADEQEAVKPAAPSAGMSGAQPVTPAPAQPDKPVEAAISNAPDAAPAAAQNDTPPVIDLSGKEPSEAVEAPDEAAKRRAHEEAEAKRKAEWEAQQREKKLAEQAAIRQIQELPDALASKNAVCRVGADTEKLTRRNMKEVVCEHIQELCKSDPAFARLTLHPRKTMIRCFKYINRKARDYAKEEMENLGLKPPNGRPGGDVYDCSIYSTDIPDSLCYQWAEDYFRDPDAPEDKGNEPKFVPKPYVGKSASSKSKAKTTARKPHTEKPAEKEPKESTEPIQISLEMM